MFIAANPFISSYTQSDAFGKAIFWGLFLLSALSWSLLVHKGWLMIRVRRFSAELLSLLQGKDPLTAQLQKALATPNPFFEIYKNLKHHALQLIQRNRFFAEETHLSSLSEADLALIEGQLQSTIASQMKDLEKHLFLLSTVVTLGPFLGLLGTVWGILLTFSALPTTGSSALGNSAMLAGLSMALATTVVGLLVAIPALIGHNYLKNALREYRREMESFADHLLTAVELQYRTPQHAQKAPSTP